MSEKLSQNPEQPDFPLSAEAADAFEWQKASFEEFMEHAPAILAEMSPNSRRVYAAIAEKTVTNADTVNEDSELFTHLPSAVEVAEIIAGNRKKSLYGGNDMELVYSIVLAKLPVAVERSKDKREERDIEKILMASSGPSVGRAFRRKQIETLQNEDERPKEIARKIGRNVYQLIPENRPNRQPLALVIDQGGMRNRPVLEERVEKLIANRAPTDARGLELLAGNKHIEHWTRAIRRFDADRRQTISEDLRNLLSACRHLGLDDEEGYPVAEAWRYSEALLDYALEPGAEVTVAKEERVRTGESVTPMMIEQRFDGLCNWLGRLTIPIKR